MHVFAQFSIKRLAASHYSVPIIDLVIAWNLEARHQHLSLGENIHHKGFPVKGKCSLELKRIRFTIKELVLFLSETVITRVAF